MADHIPQLVQGVRSSQANPEDLSAQLALIIASQNFLQVQTVILKIVSAKTLLLSSFSPPFRLLSVINTVSLGTLFK